MRAIDLVGFVGHRIHVARNRGARVIPQGTWGGFARPDFGAGFIATGCGLR